MSIRRLFIVLFTVIILLPFSDIWAGSYPLDKWEWRNPVPQGDGLNRVAYGNGTYVAVGWHGTILTSPDGVFWTNRESGTVNSLHGVTYGNGEFIVVGSGGTILASPDGVSWTIRMIDMFYTLQDVVYGNGLYVAVGGHGPILTSPDGVNWTNWGTYYSLLDVEYGQGMFAAVDAWSFIYTSPDGVTWTVAANIDMDGKPISLRGVKYGNGKFVVVGGVHDYLTNETSSVVAVSADGVTWNTQSLDLHYNLAGITYGNNMYVATAYGGKIATSADGEVWTAQGVVTGDLFGITYGGGLFVAVGESDWDISYEIKPVIVTSSDGTSWSLQGARTDWLSGAAYGNGTFVAAGSGGTILASRDCVSWAEHFSGTDNWLSAVTYGDEGFVAVGEKGTVLTSPEGEDWSEQDSGTESWLYGIAHANGTYVVVGDGGDILTSPDGVTWTSQVSGTFNPLYGVAYGDGKFVAVGAATVLTSEDGVSWTEQIPANTNLLYAVAYGNGVFVAVGAGVILLSSDGETWTTQSAPLSDLFNGITFADGIFVGVANSGRVISSSDGVTWKDYYTTQNRRLNGVTYGNSTFVVVGSDGRILQSGSFIKHTVTITKLGTGWGMVRGDGSTIECGPVCSGQVYQGLVDFSAGSDYSSTFAGWSGDCSGFGTICSIVVDRDMTITATFSSKADFNATPMSGQAPLFVSFTDTSINSPTQWQWSFGDGETSGVRNPTHTFTTPGSYAVHLVATGQWVTAGVTKTITVGACTNSPARLSGVPYGSVMGAYAPAHDDDVIQLQAVTFTEDINLTNDTRVIIKGGHSCDFGANPSHTAIQGSVAILSGTVTFENVVIR